jgi:hypothetical protein
MDLYWFRYKVPYVEWRMFFIYCIIRVYRALMGLSMVTSYECRIFEWVNIFLYSLGVRLQMGCQIISIYQAILSNSIRPTWFAWFPRLSSGYLAFQVADAPYLVWVSFLLGPPRPNRAYLYSPSGGGYLGGHYNDNFNTQRCCAKDKTMIIDFFSIRPVWILGIEFILIIII